MSGSDVEWCDPTFSGPRLLLDYALLDTWHPTREQYEEVCAAVGDGWLATSPWGEGSAIVLGSHNMTAWVPNPLVGQPCVGLLVRWESGPDCQTVASHLGAVDFAGFEEGGIPWTAAGPMMLFAAVEPGDDITSASMVVEVPPGNYRIGVVEFTPDEETSLILHPFHKS